MLKQCSQCSLKKETIEFYKNSRTPDGLQSYCKVCYQKYDRYRYYTHKEKRLAKERKYYNLHKDKANEKSLKSKAKYPEKWKARQDLRNAVASGKIKKLPCEVCGDEKVHGHHEDYKKPFQVQWLCVKHHYEKHRKYNVGR